MTTATAMAISLLALVGLSACDEDNAQPQGGGPGSSKAVDIQATGNGFCDPQGGEVSVGQASYTSSSEAKIDTDGDPNAQGQDVTWNANTSGTVNGQPVNSATYAYVVMSQTQMDQSHVALGDWALVTNNATGQSTWARVEDVGPEGGEGEVSKAAAAAVGISSTVISTKDGPNTVTVGNPSVTVKAYAGTSGLQSDCNQVAQNP